MARQDFPRKDRVRTRAEIDRVFTSGSRHSCKGMRLHVLANGRGANRVVIVPVRSYSGAVARNRAKRLLRECWRLRKPSFTCLGFDCVIVLYPGVDSFVGRNDQLGRLLSQVGILGGRS